MSECYQSEKCHTIKDIIHKRVTIYPEQPVFILWDSDHVSQKRIMPNVFFRQVATLGSWFLQKGFHHKKVAIYGENSYEWILTYFALVCSGNIAVLLDYHLLADDIMSLLTFNECDAVCYSFVYKDIADKLKSNLSIPFYDLSDLSQIASDEHISFDLYLSECVMSDDAAVIAFTSGTTGIKKGVVLTHSNIVEDIIGSAKYVDHSGNTMIILPLYHMFGMAGLIISLVCGGTIILCDSIRYIVQDIISIQPQNIEVVPAMLPAVYQGFSHINNCSGCKIFCGGAPADIEWKPRFKALGVDLFFGYGMTECSPLIAINTELYDRSDGRMKVMDFNEVIISCPDENNIGEVLVKGPNVMRGYYKLPEETAKVIIDGWLHTGDLGTLDEDGFLLLTGRKKNLLVLPNGENISPEDLERKVLSIHGVQECLAYLDDLLLTVELFVQNEDEKNILDSIKNINKSLSASHRIMKTVFRETPFKKNATGKIIRE